jgi:hypothetical protein
MLGRRGDTQQRRLAGAVGPDDHPAFIELDRPGHRPDQGVAVAAQRHIGEVDQQVGVDCLVSLVGSTLGFSRILGFHLRLPVSATRPSCRTATS